MKYCKSCADCIMFTSTQLMIIFVAFLVYYTTDDYSNSQTSLTTNIKFPSFLPFHKLLFFPLIFLTFYSHWKTFLTDPGKITHTHNFQYLQFYYNTHRARILNANEYKKTQKNKNKKFKQENNYSDYDEREYPPETTIPDDLKDQIANKYKIKLNRCKQCYIVRSYRTHHCPDCEGCVFERHHHCPWVGNCIGQFNQKFFILDNIYSVIVNIQSIYICIYYGIYKNYMYNVEYPFWIIGITFQFLINLIFLLFSIVLLFEQWGDIKNQCVIYDSSRGGVVEYCTFQEQLEDIFGGKFNIQWLFPFTIGGHYYLFKEMINKKEI